MAKMNDQVPKERLSISGLNHVFLKIYLTVYTPLDSVLTFMQSKIKSVRQIF